MEPRKSPLALASLGLGAVVVVSLVLFSTCQKGDGGSIEGTGGSEDATALTGTWSTGCQADQTKAGYYSKDTRTFEGTSFTTTFESFSDEACKAGLMSQTQTGGFVIGDTAEGSDAVELDITIGAITITLHTDALVSSYNSKKFCGGGWEKGTARTISRAECAGDESGEDDLVYDVFASREGSLYFGKKDSVHTGKSESQRPQALDESRPFTKS